MPASPSRSNTDLVLRLAGGHEVMITLEEGSIGGFSSQVLHVLAVNGVLDRGLKVRPMILPDVFLNHDKPQLQYAAAGLQARHILATALDASEHVPNSRILDISRELAP